VWWNSWINFEQDFVARNAFYREMAVIIFIEFDFTIQMIPELINIHFSIPIEG